MANKVGHWMHDHKREILIVGGIAVFAGIAVCAVRSVETIQSQSKIIQSQSEFIKVQRVQIADLKDLCMAKDDHVKQLASKLLREGNSEGGKLMADLKAFYNAA